MGGRGTVWGEGFADDSWAQLARVDRWDLVHPDELLRAFPALVASAGRSALLIGRLEEAVAVRWRRLRGGSSSRDLHLKSLDADALVRLAEDHEASWFPPRGPLRSALGHLLGTGSGLGAPGSGEEAAVLALDDLLAALRAGRAAPYAEHRALSLAFHAGIHPAHVWSEALALHECATAIGWLGVVARGRDALLPPDIAATLADTIAGTEAAGRPRDQRFALYGFTPAQWGALGLTARRCLEGRREPVRLSQAVRPAAERDGPALPAGAVHRFVMGAATSMRARRRAS